MKFLIIDNGTIRMKELKKMLSGNIYELMEFDKIDLKKAEEFDIIILTGGSKFPVLGNEDLYKREISLIKNSSRPIIGICLGFELIAHAFGAKLTKIDEKVHGIIKIDIYNNSKLFFNISNLNVYESHKWVIKKLPEYFVTLAKSEYGIEAFRDKNRRLYGFQFHLSVFPEKTCGYEVFNNLLVDIKNTSS